MQIVCMFLFDFRERQTSLLLKALDLMIESIKRSTITNRLFIELPSQCLAIIRVCFYRTDKFNWDYSTIISSGISKVTQALSKAHKLKHIARGLQYYSQWYNCNCRLDQINTWADNYKIYIAYHETSLVYAVQRWTRVLRLEVIGWQKSLCFQL